MSSLHRRCNDREEARRSWGPADKEEGNRDFWASIQEPYNYIMGSNLIPDSYQVTELSKNCRVFQIKVFIDFYLYVYGDLSRWARLTYLLSYYDFICKFENCAVYRWSYILTFDMRGCWNILKYERWCWLLLLSLVSSYILSSSSILAPINISEIPTCIVQNKIILVN